MKDEIEIYIENKLISTRLEDIHLLLTFALYNHCNFEIKIIRRKN